jgi:hypothetical protein
MILGGNEHKTHPFTLDAKKIHDNKKLYTLSRIQEELSALNHQLASKNLKRIKVHGTGRNGSRLKIDFCHALVQARIASLNTRRGAKDDYSMPALPKPEEKHEQQESRGQEEEHQQQGPKPAGSVNYHATSSTEQLLIETPLRPLYVHQTPKASIDHFFVSNTTEDGKSGSFNSIKEFHLENTIEKRNQLERNTNQHEMLVEKETCKEDDFGALIRSFASPFLQEPLSC